MMKPDITAVVRKLKLLGSGFVVTLRESADEHEVVADDDAAFALELPNRFLTTLESGACKTKSAINARQRIT